MSGGNDREERLEARVAELEATVRGLTEEFVDVTERVRLLEEELGLRGEDNSVAGTADEGRDEAPNSPESREEEKSETAQRNDDIIVA